MLDAALNLAGLLLMVIVACHTLVLHRRLTRLRGALAEAGTVLPSLDASVGRMSEVVDGFAQRLQTDLAAVEARLASARRAAAELASVNRSAEEASTHLDRLLRQHRRMEDVRATAIPRELIEPKGFAERAGLPKIGPLTPDEPARPDVARPELVLARPDVARADVTRPDAARPALARIEPRLEPVRTMTNELVS